MNYIARMPVSGFQFSLSKLSPIFARLQSTISNKSDPSLYEANEILDSRRAAASEDQKTQEILSKVNSQIREKTHSRLFAVIQFGERKFKITTEDIIALNTDFPAKVGDKIRLEKVLAVGSTDFTLLGRPVLSKDLLKIEATVIEKTYIVPRPLFRHGLHYRRLHWFRTPYVLFCINNIEFINTLDSLPAVENVQNRVIY